MSKLTTRRTGHFSRIAILSFFSFSLLVAAQRPAHADPPPVVAPSTSSASPAPTPPIATPISLDDLVITNDGSRYRGTIVESSSTQVQIALPTGKIQAIPRSNVSYAGPFSKAPADPGSSSPVSPIASSPVDEPKPQQAEALSNDSSSKVVLEAVGANQLTFHLRTGTEFVPVVRAVGNVAVPGLASVGQYEAMCTAPCSYSLRNGTYRLAFSRAGDSLIEGTPSVAIRGPSRIKATYNDNYWWRVGAVVGGLGLGVTGVWLLATSGEETPGKCYQGVEVDPVTGNTTHPTHCASPEHSTNMTKLLVGTGLLTAPVVGLLLVFVWKDSVSVEVSALKEALRSIRLAPLVASETPAGRTQAAPGLTLGGAF